MGKARNLRILLVDDDDDHAELISFHLKRKSGLEEIVDRARDGEEAITYLLSCEARKSPFPDLVLLDINVPKVNGLEVLEKIKKDTSLRAIPVIILTTSESPKDRLKAYLNFANSFVIKPANFDEFSQLIKDLSTYWGKWNQRLEN